MIIWINGAFGSGKTSVANILNSRIEKSYLYDPEEVGQFLRGNMPDEIQFYNFQDHPLWRGLNYEVLRFLNSEYQGHVIVPMNLIDRSYYFEIFEKLCEEGINAKMFTLIASKETLLKRLEKRGDGENSWAANQINSCIKAFSENEFGTHIDTNNINSEELSNLILKSCGL